MVSSNLNLNLLRFYCAHPNVHTISRKIIAIFFKIYPEVDDDFVKNNFHTDSRLQKENNRQIKRTNLDRYPDMICI